MPIILFTAAVVIVVALIAWVCSVIPVPPPLGWIKWIVPLLALIIGLWMIMAKLGIA